MGAVLEFGVVQGLVAFDRVVALDVSYFLVLKGKTKCSVLISAAAAARVGQLFLVLARAAEVLTRGCFPGVRRFSPRYERGERRTFGG
ncbi:hypothetical protein NDU88_006774 [Pleurodeles waltl]|uniref:Secreted protein n=1 Tax=Pleurodeles waltl TaxID=8319 RepID=A0AAV7VQK4_PLEWA|nr:hypothetical protein NDU88_006774 [Pleurodeles waltl]